MSEHIAGEGTATQRVPHATVSHTVLIVDDDPALRKVTGHILALDGYRVLTADTFEAGESALADSAPDLLIVDVRLGVFNGLQLVVTANRTIPTIVITGYDDVTLSRAARQFGAEYLVKPVPAALLLATVRRQLGLEEFSSVAVRRSP